MRSEIRQPTPAHYPATLSWLRGCTNPATVATTEKLAVAPVEGMSLGHHDQHRNDTYGANGKITPFDESLPDLDDAPEPVLSAAIQRDQGALPVRHRLSSEQFVSTGFVMGVVAAVERSVGISLSETEAIGILIHARRAEAMHSAAWVSPAVESTVLDTLARILVRQPWPEGEPHMTFIHAMKIRAIELGMRVTEVDGERPTTQAGRPGNLRLWL